ncbi:hypothetical protein [Baekduia sp. Peel2402]|uniref:hypothetical protein n=1 Tax=Baekduia sp. Peel2402 TaxID=3458296 RepID=UPI00403ED2EF
MAFRRLPAAAAAVLTAAVALGASAASAAAAAPWTSPVTTPGASATPAPLIITTNGHALAFPSSSTAPTQIVPLDLASGAPNGTIRPITIASTMAAAYARDHWVLAGSTLDSRGTISDKSHVQVGYGSGASDLGPLKGISGSTGRHAFGLAANDDGVVAIVIGNTTERRLLIRRPDGRGFVQAFSTKVGSQGRGATVAVGAKGDVLMVWENEHHIYARHVGPSGSVGSVHHVGDGVQSHLQAAVEAGGRLMIAWVSQRVGEGDAHTPASVYFVTAAPGKAFNKARHLEDVGVEGTGRYVSDPAVRLITGGASLLAWTGYDAASSHYVVRVASLSGGHVGTAQNVSGTSANAVLGDLSVDDDGTAAVIWRTGIAGADPDNGPQSIAAATRATPSAPFGAPETIASAPAAVTGSATNTSFPYTPQITLAPTTGAALAEFGQFAGTSSLFSVAARPAP